MSGTPRIPTVCGGFVDIPQKAFCGAHTPQQVQVTFSRFTNDTLKDDCIIMNGILLATRNDHLIYSCGGLMVKIYDTCGKPNEEIIVRIVND
jgi:hypothetical protein